MNIDGESVDSMESVMKNEINIPKHRFPNCIVWTPLPILSWFIPIIGHMGIATTSGVIRDFAGPYTVTEDDMAFGWPTKYWQLDMDSVGKDVWDRAVSDACDEYKTRTHNLCCDNCHSHVAYALNSMRYNGHSNWNMVSLCFLMLFHSRFTG